MLEWLLIILATIFILIAIFCKEEDKKSILTLCFIANSACTIVAILTQKWYSFVYDLIVLTWNELELIACKKAGK